MTSNINSSQGTVECEIVFGDHSDSDFGPISADPVITFGGTQYRWVTQLSVNNEKYGAAEGSPVQNNLVVEEGEYINSVEAAHWYGAYNFITYLKFTTNRGKTWVIEGAEAPGKTKEKYASLKLENIRLLSFGGSHGGLGDSLKQIKLRYLDNYFVEDKAENTNGEKLYAILDVTGQGTIEVFESTEARELEAISSVNEITASVETEINQSYLLAEATSRLGLSYMNRQELRVEKEKFEKLSSKRTIPIKEGQIGIGLCQIEVKKLKTSKDGEERYLLVPIRGKEVYPWAIADIKNKQFFDLSSNLQFLIPELKFQSKYGWDNFHAIEG